MTRSLWLVLCAACNGTPPELPNMSFDGLPALATVQVVSARDRGWITMDPQNATLGGEIVGQIALSFALWNTADCSDCTGVTVPLDGHDTTGTLVYGVMMYAIGERATAQDPCPLTLTSDPQQQQIGAITGELELRHLDKDSARMALHLWPQFGPGFPTPGFVHDIYLADVDVTFQHY